MAGRHAAPWSLFTEPRHTTDIVLPPTEWTVAGTIDPVPLGLPMPRLSTFATSNIDIPASQEAGRFTPSDSLGDPWDTRGRTL